MVYEPPITRSQAQEGRKDKKINSAAHLDLAERLASLINSLPADKMRAIFSLILTSGSDEEDRNSQAESTHDKDGDLIEDGTAWAGTKFRLEIVLASTQSYYKKSQK